MDISKLEDTILYTVSKETVYLTEAKQDGNQIEPISFKKDDSFVLVEKDLTAEEMKQNHGCDFAVKSILFTVLYHLESKKKYFLVYPNTDKEHFGELFSSTQIG